MSITLPNGIGETLGDTLVTNSPIYTSNRIHYVHSGTGSDSAGYGETKTKPYASLAYAMASGNPALASGDIVVLLDGHEETVTTAIDIGQGLVIVGSGETDGEPTVTFQNNGVTAHIMTLSAAEVELRNIKFAAFESAQPDNQVDVAGSDCRIIGCLFEANGNNTATQLDIAASLTTTVKNCTFRSTATAANSLPTVGLACGAAGILFLENCVFDNGTYGYGTAAMTCSGDLRGEGNSFLRDARLELSDSADVILAGGTVTGGIQWVEV